MKDFTKIFLAIVLSSSIQIGFANTDGSGDKKEDKQEQQLGQQTGEKKSAQDVDATLVSDVMDGEDQDSVQDDSVSKYNFIFYFLYKFKYDQEEEL